MTARVAIVRCQNPWLLNQSVAFWARALVTATGSAFSALVRATKKSINEVRLISQPLGERIAASLMRVPSLATHPFSTHRMTAWGL
jgi:hypothetical protein